MVELTVWIVLAALTDSILSRKIASLTGQYLLELIVGTREIP